MAVSTTNAYSGPYTANGSTTSFPFTFQALAADDVSVLLRATDGTETVATGFTVSFSGVVPSTGTVTFEVAPASGVKVIPYLDVDFVQQTSFADGSAWRASAVNNTNDRAALRDQILKREADRALRAPIDEGGFVLPASTDRANKALFFAEDGAPSTISVDDFAAPAAASAALAETLSTIIALIAAGLLFDDADAGVAGVADGETFVTWEDERLRIYLRSGGSAVPKAEIATAAMLAALVDGVAGDVIADVNASLAVSGGSALVGFIHSLTNAVARTAQSKLRDTVSPEDFGAVGDGVADDYTPMLRALQSGRVVDGNGRTYAIGTALAPSSFKGLRNANLKWANTAVMATQAFLLSIIDQSRCFVDNCTFDLGTVENAGSADDSSRGGLKIASSNVGVTYVDYIRVTNCRAFGNGNGTGFYLRSLRYSLVSGNTCHDRIVAASPDPTNDCQNGFDLTAAKHVTFIGNISRDQQTRLSGSLAKRYSRGFLFAEVLNSTVSSCIAADVDQGFDFSGAITATLTEGNSNLAVSGCSTRETTTYGFKFANCAHDIAVSGCVSERFGFCGFVAASPNTTPLDASKNTQRIVFTGCYAFNPTGAFNSNNSGFRIMQGSAGTNYPRGIKFIGCHVWDGTGGNKMPYGFLSDVTYDAASQLPNEMIACSSRGHVTGASSGFSYTVAQLPSAAPLGSRMCVTDANATTFNSTVAGGGSNAVPVWFDGTNWKIG